MNGNVEARPSEALAALNHDLRTPLNAILGFAELLTEADPIDPRFRRYAENIRSSGHRLLITVDAVLALARDMESIRAGNRGDRITVQGGPRT